MWSANPIGTASVSIVRLLVVTLFVLQQYPEASSYYCVASLWPALQLIWYHAFLLADFAADFGIAFLLADFAADLHFFGPMIGHFELFRPKGP